MSNATKINLDSASRVDVTCRKGDTFSLKLTITTAEGAAAFQATDVFLFEVRDSDTGELVSNTASPTAQFKKEVTASTDDATNKSISITVDAQTMKTMPSGLYVYDVEQKVVKESDLTTDLANPTVATLIFGTLKVNEDVSETSFS